MFGASFGAEEQAQRRVFVRQAFVFVKPAQIKFHFAFVFGFKFADF